MGDRDALTLAGAASDPALTVAGDTWTYAELAAQVDAAPTGPLVDVSGMTLPSSLAAAFAAARSGTAVLVRDPALPAPRIACLPPGTWLVAMTSGSSGRPRAVCRTARSWALSIQPLAEIAGLSPADRVTLTGPLHATLHLFAAIHTLCVGAHLTDDVREATAVHCVPAVLAELTAPEPRAPHLRTAVVAGSPLPDAVAREAAAHGISVTEYYGAAELSFVAIRRWPEPTLRPFPGVDLRLGADGRLWARSPYCALGYAGIAPSAGTEPTAGTYGAGPVTGPGEAGASAVPEDSTTTARRQPPIGAGVAQERATEGVRAGATADRTADPASAGPAGPLRVDEDGFATVGDLARAAETGPMGGLTILGRGDAAITVGGATVLAEDVEAALDAIPGVVAAAAVAQPHPRLGEIVAAVLELDGTAPLTSIRSAARAALSGPSLPRRYVIVEHLPRTAAGKVARAAARRILEPDG